MESDGPNFTSIHTIHDRMENHDAMTRREKIQLTMVACMVLCIILFVFTIVVLVNNIDAIKNNPIEYAIEKSNLNSCTCSIEGGGYVVYPENTKVTINGTGRDPRIIR